MRRRRPASSLVARQRQREDLLPIDAVAHDVRGVLARTLEGSLVPEDVGHERSGGTTRFTRGLRPVRARRSGRTPASLTASGQDGI